MKTWQRNIWKNVQNMKIRKKTENFIKNHKVCKNKNISKNKKTAMQN